MFRLLLAILQVIEKAVLLDSAAQGVRAFLIHAVLALLACILAVGALGCGAAALWIWALAPFGPAGAPLLVAAVLAVGCVVTLFTMGRLWRHQRAAAPRTMLQAARHEALLPARLTSAAVHGFLLGLAGEEVAGKSGLAKHPCLQD